MIRSTWIEAIPYAVVALAIVMVICGLCRMEADAQIELRRPSALCQRVADDAARVEALAQAARIESVTGGRP